MLPRCATLGAAALVLACRGATPTLGLAPSFAPNLGVAASLSHPVRGTGPWEVELRFTEQFVDDKAFADNGFEEAGDWTQLDLGLLRFFTEEEGLAWSTRFGVVGIRARGEPNLADESGDYLGGYLGFGRFRFFGNGFAFGPELTLLIASGPDPLVLVPQLTWGLRWSPGPRR